MAARKTISPQNLFPYYDTDEREGAVEKALEAVRPQVVRKIGKWTLLRMVRRPRSTILQAMVNENGQAAISLEKRKGGALIFKQNGKTQDIQPDFRTRNIRRMMIWRVEEELTKAVCRRADNILAQEILSGTYSKILRDAVIDSALEIANEAIIQDQSEQESEIPTKQVNRKNYTRAVRKILEEHFIQEDVKSLAKRIIATRTRPFPEVTPNAYNNTLLNLEIFGELQKSSPRIIAHYLEHMAPRSHAPVKFKHPGQIVQAVREELRLTPSEWRYFCRLQHPFLSTKSHEEVLEGIRQGMKMLADINVPRAPDTILAKIIYGMNYHHHFQTALWRCGDPRDAWVNTIRQYLEAMVEYRDKNPGAEGYARDPWGASDPIEPGKAGNLEFQELINAGDALLGHIRDEMPWGHGDWDNIQARSERWHHRETERRERERARQEELRKDPNYKEEESSWTSLIPTQTHDGVEMRPLTTSQELRETAKTMHNCIETYRGRCETNTSRIFTIHQGGKLVAAAELIISQGEWRVGQVEGRNRRRRIPRPVILAVGKLRDSYQKAQELRERKEQGEK